MGFPALLGTAALSTIQLPAWFGDGMVLQTNSEYGARSFITGRADPGEKVVVRIEDSTSRTFPGVADVHGDWEIQVHHACMDSSTACTITVSGEDGATTVAHDVLGGDVFF